MLQDIKSVKRYQIGTVVYNNFDINRESMSKESVWALSCILLKTLALLIHGSQMANPITFKSLFHNSL